jgi:hypothetical protein
LNKLTNILFTVAFTVSCLGIWLFTTVAQSLYPGQWFRTGYLPVYTNLVLTNKWWFLIIPIPFLFFSIFLALRKQPTSEFNLLYLGILAIIFSILFFPTVSCLLFPLIPHQE